MSQESMEFDIIIVGAGPAGLATAVRLGQLNQYLEKKLSICVLEKAANVGAQILSGAVFDPRALNELLPDWQKLNAPLLTPATHDEFILLTTKRSWRLPVPSPMRNHGNYIISLEKLCQWLAVQAQQLGVEIFTGFSGVKLRFNEQGHVNGIITGDFGIDKQGQPSQRFQAGIELIAKQTILAEGCRGSLSKQAIEHFQLRATDKPQTYALGIKELWEVTPEQHHPGKVIHTIGWPLDRKTYGGSFIYHLENQRVAVGFVTGLDYANPYLDPFQELQRFKTHPSIRPTFINGKRLVYGARALNEGGLQGLPKLTFPGGLLIGCSAGFLNVPQIKGSHTAMKSGMIAAETIVNALTSGINRELTEYSMNIQSSWIWQELYRARNIRPAFRWGLWAGLSYAAFDNYILRGHAPWTLKNHADFSCLKKATQSKKINYPKPDNQVSFDKLSSLHLANISHGENQPCHLQLKDPALAIEVNYQLYASPESRYCPANVYEIVATENQPKLQINAANCLHCKACDIKDPCQNINWVPPEGGSGPNYFDM